ncbi:MULTISPECIES: TIGR02281 family clan AA aspartic protease [Rhizobium/Agrobacterium group]|uniref:TIGR02281 family clan AA aspartic protease n=1 Tax=Rhizobium/Agrobacterium group TaxID=227290 RepID=UPI0023004221|nr:MULTISPECIES: TIGR02281 family clan AA aspartic protease [Rhizobium/Agrobacterium group]MDA5631566.1 TIGR02281 family clan AA aspartic protease [Agrobacterium sp. ST15.16.024]MDF1887427.1 TIGR02281 family clan AA aspartic protease [Rhizobium rhizogenes]
MLARTIFLLIGLSVSATQIPALVEKFQQRPETDVEKPAAAPEVAKPQTASLGGINLKADTRGHFNATFRINGKSFDGLVDTGASMVAINETIARRLGYGVNSLDYKYAISTANGQTMAAYVKLDRVEIGPIRVQNVDAMVLKDNALSNMLIGMSFLKQLSSFKVSGGEMRLVR